MLAMERRAVDRDQAAVDGPALVAAVQIEEALPCVLVRSFAQVIEEWPSLCQRGKQLRRDLFRAVVERLPPLPSAIPGLAAVRRCG